MKPKMFSVPDAKRRALYKDQQSGEIRGILKEWKSTYGPGAPYAGGHEAANPCRALKAGVGKESLRKGSNKGANQ